MVLHNNELQHNNYSSVHKGMSHLFVVWVVSSWFLSMHTLHTTHISLLLRASIATQFISVVSLYTCCSCAVLYIIAPFIHVFIDGLSRQQRGVHVLHFHGKASEGGDERGLQTHCCMHCM